MYLCFDFGKVLQRYKKNGNRQEISQNYFIIMLKLCVLGSREQISGWGLRWLLKGVACRVVELGVLRDGT